MATMKHPVAFSIINGVVRWKQGGKVWESKLKKGDTLKDILQAMLLFGAL